MLSKVRVPLLAVIAMLALVVAATAGCGDSSDGNSATAAAAEPADVEAAQAVVTKAEGPTPFPVEQPLKKKLRPDQKLGFLQCATPFCGLFAQLYGVGTKAMGISPVQAVKAGHSADDIQTALSSIAAKRPSALLLPGLNVSSLGNGLSTFKDAGIPVAAIAVMAGPEVGIDAVSAGPANFQAAGRTLADWAIVEAKGKANIGWYGIPELDFTKVEREAFEVELKKNCPSCEVRSVDIPIATVGSTAPSRIVSDLQAHPDTNVILFPAFETATGLPAALRTAGIDVKIAGTGPTPGNLQDLKTGGFDAAVVQDVGVMVFTQLDEAVRLATGQPLTPNERTLPTPYQLITKEDLPDDVSKGFSIYPDFVERFGKLWSGARATG
ncbi:hypothetical protein DSM104299_00445 [Baekduia alba]|uniref:sugar ABC transporter substrate-binding protein n=1 Tax=Baekduia alba TaxID=2997333 RepID=UPI0023400057|nr:sugar ABC transporter substrate-binding protein [Baekduia alba]WCB91768.1 hypothetical protein DSM104299_00445 [Baekduia alba]